MKKVHLGVIIAGAAVGLAALILTALGNPTNMGFCIACFLRDISGAVGLHSAAKVQYVRPEIIGLVLGAFIMSVASKEFKARAGSSPAIRFVLGAFVVIGALAFLGCPLRMVLRLGGGDLNALVGLIGFTGGILLGIASLKKGFSLKRSYEAHKAEGGVLPAVMAALLILVVTVPALFKFSEEGPGSMRAPFWIALVIALVVGALAQKSRLCMVGGLRDAFMLKDFHLLYGFVAIFVVTLVGNLAMGKFHLGFALQPIAHSAHLWNLLGMVLVGWGSVLLGGGTGVVQQLVAHPPQQGLHHRTFVLKIQVKSAFGHLGPGGDVLHAGLGGAALQKQLVGCIQQGPALFLFFAFHGTHALGRFLFSLFFSRSYVALVGCLNHFSSPAAIVQERFLIQSPAHDKKTDF